MLLIGQSVMPEKYERTPGSWREKARALESGIRETVDKAGAMSESPPKTSILN